jgi:hypothetical protein
VRDSVILAPFAIAEASDFEPLPALQDAVFIKYLKDDQESVEELKDVVKELLVGRTQVRTIWGCIQEAAAILDVLQVFPRSTVYEVCCT